VQALEDRAIMDHASFLGTEYDNSSILSPASKRIKSDEVQISKGDDFQNHSGPEPRAEMKQEMVGKHMFDHFEEASEDDGEANDDNDEARHRLKSQPYFRLAISMALPASSLDLIMSPQDILPLLIQPLAPFSTTFEQQQLGLNEGLL
jgi:hypothetical protein